MKDMQWRAGVWGFEREALRSSDGTICQGTCTFSCDTGVSLVLPYGNLSERTALKETGIYASGPESATRPFVYGETQDGTRLVLTDALTQGVGGHFPGATTETFGAHAVLASKGEIDPCQKVVEARIYLRGLWEWFRLDCRDLLLKGADGAIQVPDKPFPEERTALYTTDDLTVCFCRGVEARIGSSEVHVGGECHIEVQVRNGTSLESVWPDILSPIQRFFTFCMGSFVPVDSIFVKLDRSDSWCDVYMQITGSQEDVASPKQAFVPIPYSAIRPSISRAFSSWMELKGDVSIGAMMLTSLLGDWRMPYDLKFLAASQMYEALARHNDEEIQDKVEFRKKVNTALSSEGTSEREWARKILSGCNRLSYRDLIKRALAETAPFSSQLVPDGDAFAREQKAMRNTLTHRNDSISKDEYEKLALHTEGQMVLAYPLLIHLLGLGEGVMDAFMSSQFDNLIRPKLKNRFARRDDES